MPPQCVVRASTLYVRPSGRVKQNSVSLLTDLSKVVPLWMSTDE